MTPTKEMYDAAFAKEAANKYPIIDQLERKLGYAVDPLKLQAAARVLACPVKKNPPFWQHGRIVYAVARKRLERWSDPVWFLDIGTAKGFSALCALWAIHDAKAVGEVHSTDVIHPDSTEPRNTVADLDGPKTLAQVLEPWPESQVIEFYALSGVHWLQTGGSNGARIHFAFVDGKHTFEAVSEEAKLLRERQKFGDVIVFDDLQYPGVAKALHVLYGYYETQTIIALPNRSLAVAWRIR